MTLDTEPDVTVLECDVFPTCRSAPRRAVVVRPRGDTRYAGRTLDLEFDPRRVLVTSGGRETR